MEAPAGTSESGVVFKTLLVFEPSAGRWGVGFVHEPSTTEAKVSVDILAGPAVLKTTAFWEAPAGTTENALWATFV